MSPSDRRTVLATLGSVMAASLAGCPGGNSTGTTGQPTEEPVTTSTTDRPTPNTTTDGEPYTETTLQRARETGIAVRDSVVAMSLDPPSIAGTGWYFGSSDLVVTAGHVIAVRDTGWTAWQPDGTQVDLRYLGDAYIDGVDVGALRADISGPPLSAGSADDLDPGQPLVQVGHPGGVGNWVIALGRYLGETTEDGDGFLTSIPAEGSASGSPVVTLQGEVVGLTASVQFADAPTEGTADRPATPVYGPGDRVETNVHVGVDVITERVAGWTDG